MRTRRISWLAVAVCTVAASAAAQDGPTRAGEAAAAREAKAAAADPFRPGAVERLLTRLESSPASRRIFQPSDGFGIRIGGIPHGTGFAAGPMWRRRNPFPAASELHTSAAAGVNGDRQIEAGATFGRRHVVGSLQATSTSLAAERFFGRGNDTLRADQTAFRLDTREVGASLAMTPGRWLHVTAGTSALRTTTADANAPGLSGVGTRFDGSEAPGLHRDVDFRVVSGRAALDYRDMPGNPRRGGRYEVAVSRYLDTSDRYTFTRLDVDLEQHVSAWKRQRVLTLRAMTSASMTADGREVPFHLQRTLGGSRVLRGFVTDRFRDTHLMALQAEYGFDVLPFVNTVVFYEAGAVGARWQDLSLGNLRRDYGLGFRFGGARNVAIRTDVAFGSGEGTRLTMRFGHAF